jgi:hypothetical protein
MILSVLEDPVVQLLVFVFGSMTIRKIRKANKVRQGGGKPEAKARVRRPIEPGFRGLKWGEEPRPDMVLYHDGLIEKLYTRRGEALKLGAVHVKSIVYSYHLGRLQAVLMEIPRRASADALTSLLTEWGIPRTLGEPGARKRYWTELGTGANAMQAVFDEAPGSPVASLVVSSKVMADQRGLDERPRIRRQEVRLEAAMEAAR